MPQPSLFAARFSCRSFAGTALSEADTEYLLEAARWAPSAGNRQPWRFVVVTAAATKALLATAAFGQEFVAQAPLVIVVCALPEESARRYGDRGRSLYCLQDTAAATQNILLAASERGLGSCWVGAFDEHAVARAIAAPPGWRPVAMVPVGPALETPARRSRRPARETVVLQGT
jgi:nitroreductase